jgi:hypothetical protein
MAQVLAKHPYKAKMRTEYGEQSNKEEGNKYKIDLLQQDSIRTLCQNRVTNLLESIDTESDIEGRYNRIKGAVHQAAKEALGLRDDKGNVVNLDGMRK